MSQTIELPDPLFAEINGYANRLATSPLVIIKEAWEEYRHRHPQTAPLKPRDKAETEELLAMIRALRGSITLPSDADDDTLITEARTEKYGPL